MDARTYENTANSHGLKEDPLLRQFRALLEAPLEPSWLLVSCAVFDAVCAVLFQAVAIVAVSL